MRCGRLAPLTLSSFLLRILQAYAPKCIGVALLRPGALVPRQRRQETLASYLLTQLCVSTPALWRGVGFCVGLLRPQDRRYGGSAPEECVGVAVLRPQDRRHGRVHGGKSLGLPTVVKLGRAFPSPGRLIRGKSPHQWGAGWLNTGRVLLLVAGSSPKSKNVADSHQLTLATLILFGLSPPQVRGGP